MFIDVLWFLLGVAIVIGFPVGIIFLLNAGGGR